LGVSFMGLQMQRLRTFVSLLLDFSPQPPAREQGEGAARPLVLLAGLDPEMQRSVRRLLGPHYRTEAMSSGNADPAAVPELFPDLVLADAKPGQDGVDLLRSLLLDPRTGRAPVILLSPSAVDARHGVEAGAQDCLVKPFSGRELQARVTAQLQLAHLQREVAAREQALNATTKEAEELRRLHEFSVRLLGINGLRPVLEEVLDAIVALHGADFGLVQQVDPASGELVVVAQRNLPAAFFAHFPGVHAESTACGRAMTARSRVIVEDVLDDPSFAAHLELVATTGFRAVQATPLISRTGKLLGMISTHFRQPRSFSETELRYTDLYARQAADLVERSKSEEALRVSEARFRRYFDLGLVGMALTAPGKGCIEVNDELCRIFGYPREELLRKSWPELTHPDDLAADEAQFESVLAGLQDGYVIDKRFLRKDDSAVWCTMAAKCLRAPDGSVDCFVALVQDMTERLQADDALRRARDQLAHVARVAAMGELAASIAHEMNQPLAAIVANGHASARWLAAEPPNLGEAVTSIHRIVADAGRSEVKKEAFDMRELLRDVAGMLEREARAHKVKVLVEGEPATVVGDRVQLVQVVINLAMNGFDAMATVPDAQRCLRMRAEQDGPKRVRVSVRDAGTGLLAGDRDRIFDAFYTTKPAGMGMGLAISRSIVEAHEGRLWCAPNEGGGETFSLTLAA
jgi:PAS domain S-box-containing protein